MIMEIRRKNNTDDGKQFLTFKVGSEYFGISVDRAREVIEFRNYTAVPRVPGYIKGVINLRGEVVPIVDLPFLLHGRSNPVTRFTCIVIIDMEMQNEKVIIGVMIDSVSEVLTLSESDIGAAPDFGIKIRHDYVSGIGRAGTKFIVLLNVGAVFDIDDLSDFNKVRSYHSALQTVSG